MRVDATIFGPRWYAMLGRVLFMSFLLTLLSFAVILLGAIVVLVVSAALRGGRPDMRFAYRHVAFPAAVVAGSIVLVLSVIMEVRHYRQANAGGDCPGKPVRQVTGDR